MKKVIAVIGASSIIAFLASCNSDQAGTPQVGNTDTCIQPAGRLVTYVTDIKPILDTYCNDPAFGSCHQSDYNGGSGFDYTTYGGILGEVQNGKLMDRVFGPFSTGAQMPSSVSYGPTSFNTPCDTNLLHVWISEGGPEQ